LDSAGKTIQAYRRNKGDVSASFASAARVISQTYSYPFHGHMVLGPSCAVADVTPNGARILTYSQNINNLQTTVASLLGLPANKVRLTYFPSSGSFGNNPPCEEVTTAAAVMSQLAGKPVRLQLMRWDEHGWDQYGQAQLMDLRGGIDAKGKIVGVDTAVFLAAGSGINATTQFVGMATPSPATSVPNALGPNRTYGTDPFGAQYDLANWRILVKATQNVNTSLRLGPLRGPNAPQATWAGEQFFDELAHAANMDAVEFRRQNINQPNASRWLGVLNAVAQAANWQPKVAASKLSNADLVTGRGVALASGTSPDTYVAVVADIEVNKKTGKIIVKHIYAAEDNGLTINPALVENQIVGNVIHGVSRTLVEELRFDTKQQTSLDWVTYPILRFKDAPKVTAIVVNRPDVPPRGVGEEAHGQPGAAIANAFFDATGVRMRQAPMTPARVRATLKAAGVA
jgi:CO/xanthine dehydrogenase Mo-binding subunit